IEATLAIETILT
ncbi:hypothetical protein XELAEV_180239663mg, partial [Xenopus laevis]